MSTIDEAPVVLHECRLSEPLTVNAMWPFKSTPKKEPVTALADEPDNDALIDLLDLAIDAARDGASRRKDGWRKDAYERVERNLQAVRDKVGLGRFHVAPGAGLGATRFLSEAGLDDENLYKAVRDVEDHLRRFGAA